MDTVIAVYGTKTKSIVSRNYIAQLNFVCALSLDCSGLPTRATNLSLYSMSMVSMLSAEHVSCTLNLSSVKTCLLRFCFYMLDCYIKPTHRLDAIVLIIAKCLAVICLVVEHIDFFHV